MTKIGWVIIWGILAIAFTGAFIKGWYSNDLWNQVFLGLLALGSWLGVYKASSG